MNSQFDGKVALVTGGCSGIGLATAKLLAQRGAKVYITGRRQKELDEAVREIGQSATGIQGDVSRLEDIDKVYQAIREQKGKLAFENVPVGPSGPSSATRTASAAPSSTVSVPLYSFRLVLVKPGETALTLIPVDPSSIAMASVIALRAVLEAG
jgi:NAD(P)-dependent dehydrogenase (short-subunit alcohol dehydrogenase family)